MSGNNEGTVKKRGISELAHISTLTEEELREAEKAAEEAVSSESAEGEAEEKQSAADYLPQGIAQENAKKKRIEHTEPSFVISAKPDRKCMYEFMFYHSYMNVMGALSGVLGIAALVFVVVGLVKGFDTIQIVLFGAIAAMFLANSPLTLWFKAKKQSDMICDPKNTITYTFSDEGFDMARGADEYADFTWDKMYKVKEGKTGYYMYIARNRAFVIPRDEVTDRHGFAALLKRHVEKRLLLAKEEL